MNKITEYRRLLNELERANADMHSACMKYNEEIKKVSKLKDKLWRLQNVKKTC